jgi:hypothetical protein
LSDYERQVLALLERIAIAVERRRLTPSEDNALLLRAISAAAGVRAFSTKELIAHAQEADGELRTALLASCGLNARRLGKLLRRLEGVEHGGILIERVGQDEAGVSWVCRVSPSTSRLRFA